jgi:hypothetical protein
LYYLNRIIMPGDSQSATGFSCFRGVALEIIPTPDGLITIAQAAALTNRSQEAIRSWIRRGYKAPDGSQVKVAVKRRDGWMILVDPVEIAKAARATDPRGLFRAAFPLSAAA